MRATEQSVDVWREDALRVRKHRADRVGVEALALAESGAQVASNADRLPDVEIRRGAEAVRVPSTVGAGELITTEHFRLGNFPSHSEQRSHAN